MLPLLLIQDAHHSTTSFQFCCLYIYRAQPYIKREITEGKIYDTMGKSELYTYIHTIMRPVKRSTNLLTIVTCMQIMQIISLSSSYYVLSLDQLLTICLNLAYDIAKIIKTIIIKRFAIRVVVQLEIEYIFLKQSNMI